MHMQKGGMNMSKQQLEEQIIPSGSSNVCITDEMIDHIGILAKLELTQEEKQSAKQELVRMLAYVEKMNEPDTSDVPPTMQLFPMENVFREDEVSNTDGRRAALANAPRCRGEGFEVPWTIG